jgi:TolB-like protein
VVLPFTNIGGDPEQEYFVDGVTESLTTDLSRIAGSFVIARNSAFSYKGKSPDVRQIGRELNVRYVLEGSMQRGGNRLRVNVQLIDAESGNHLWAERDKPVADLFNMQDEIVSRLANTLNTQLITAEARRAEYAPHPSSMDLYFQGAAWLNKGPSPGYLAQRAAALNVPWRSIPAMSKLSWNGVYRRAAWCLLLGRRPRRTLRGGRSDFDKGAVFGAEPRHGALPIRPRPNLF